jgi:phage minor structural protein
MIPVLYKADATDFTTFGIGVLADCTSCSVTEERNGSYELTLKYPTNGSLYSELKKERIIKAKPNDTSSNQAFRIYRITTPISGIVTVYAQHISYDLANIAVTPFSLENVPPTVAIETVLANAVIPHNFTFQTDYSSSKDFSVDTPKSVRACLGGTDGSLMNLWGGEFEWDNFKIKHHQGRGSNNGVVIEYGKNLTKLEHDNDISDIYTDLLPYAVITDENGNEEVITLSEQILPISTTLTNRKSIIKDFTDSFDEDEEITEDKLRAKAEKYLENNPLGIESPTITISFEALWKQPEYVALLERVSLCDTVTVRHVDLGISVKTKVIKTVYDTLLEKYTTITLGSAKANLVNQVTDIEEEVETTKKTVDRFPSLMTSAITNATKLITGNSGGYVVLHTNAESGEPYELLIMDNENIADAVNVWRWNIGGLGFSSHGYNGPYETAITGDGSIVADFITTGSLVANIIKAGILSSLDGSSYWNIETGEVVLRAYATNEKVEEQSTRIDSIEEQKMYRLVISSSNGNIFKNGNISTVLTATVYSWDTDITDTLDDNQFIWTRVSDDAEDDKLWNDAHYGGTKQITITNDDVKIRATFYCDLIDTTTRESLLG